MTTKGRHAYIYNAHVSNYLNFIIIQIDEEFEDTKGVIRIRHSKKNKQNNDQTKKVQNGKQRSTQHINKTGDRVTRTVNIFNLSIINF